MKVISRCTFFKKYEPRACPQMGAFSNHQHSSSFVVGNLSNQTHGLDAVLVKNGQTDLTSLQFDVFQTSLDFSDVKPCGPTQPRIPCWCVSSDPSMCWQAIWTWDQHAQGCMGPAPRFGSLFGSSSHVRRICFGDICSQLCLQQIQARTLAKHAPPQGRFFFQLAFSFALLQGDCYCRSFLVAWTLPAGPCSFPKA